MIPSSLLLLIVTDLKEVELGTAFLNTAKGDGPLSLSQISFLASSLPHSPTASIWQHFGWDSSVSQADKKDSKNIRKFWWVKSLRWWTLPQGKCGRKVRDEDGKRQRARQQKEQSRREHSGSDASLALEPAAGMCAGGREGPPQDALPSFSGLKKEPLRKSATALGTYTLITTFLLPPKKMSNLDLGQRKRNFWLILQTGYGCLFEWGIFQF